MIAPPRRLLAALFLVVGFASSPFCRADSPYFSVRGSAPHVDSLPLKATEVHVEIGLGFAETRVTQTYVNEGATELEADYVFPAAEGASVHGLIMEVGDRRVEAVVKERGEARKVFEAARSSGRTAALLEQQRPNVFSMSLTRIRPGDTIRVELRYSERLTPEAGEYSLHFPLAIGPRYSTSADPVAAPATGQTLAADTEEPVFALHANLRPGLPVQGVTSPSHSIEVRTLQGGASVDLAPTSAGAMNRDFILRWRVGGEATRPRLLVQEWQGERFVAVTWAAADSDNEVPPLPRDFLFVIDVSGSMSGFPLETAKALLQELLSDLREGDAFNLLLFSGASATFAPTPVAATPEALARALAFVEGARGGGGTELLPALQTAFAQIRSPGRARTLVVVTDGFVDVESEAYALVASKIGDAALFPFGIGPSVNRELITRLARAGRTLPTVIEGPGRAREIAASFRHRIDHPLLAGTRLQWTGRSQVTPFPQAGPAYAGVPWSFVAKIQGDDTGAFVFSGHGPQGPFSERLELSQALRLPDGPLLAQSWARDQLDALSDRLSLGEDRETLRRQIVDVSLRYNLLTRFTSFVAVDTVVRPSTEPLVPVTQPTLSPAGADSGVTAGEVPAAPEPATWALLGVTGGAMALGWRRRKKGINAA